MFPNHFFEFYVLANTKHLDFKQHSKHHQFPKQQRNGLREILRHIE
jgi:hypothetical protein